jgi:isoleucyl-tRNA synthetase
MQASRLIVAVDDDGCFTEKVSEFKGRHVKEADKDIISSVKESQFPFPMVS